MKKLFLLLVLVALFSCEKKETQVTSIEGTWSMLEENGVDVSNADWYYVFDVATYMEYYNDDNWDHKNNCYYPTRSYVFFDNTLTLDNITYSVEFKDGLMYLTGDKILVLKKWVY